MDWKGTLEKHGLATVIALALMMLIWQMNQQAARERVDHTALLIDQISDLRAKTGDVAKACVPPPK